MAEQYFSKQPQSKSHPTTWQSNIAGETYTFTSDEGVFSKKTVDFGSRLLIETYEDPGVEGDLLDLGCGYGPIGITLARSYEERQIVMVDINERAVALAKENAVTNGVTNVHITQSNQFEQIQGRKFAAILTNPPIRAGKKLIHEMFEKSAESLVEQGELWIVIQKKQGAPSAQKKLEELFSDVQIVARKKGYYIIKGKNI